MVNRLIVRDSKQPRREWTPPFLGIAPSVGDTVQWEKHGELVSVRVEDRIFSFDGDDLTIILVGPAEFSMDDHSG